ncbi:macrocin-O-methyltransferase family protein [Paraburkholderia xenovorans LB400]|nr:TylF/MycF/NovP-related O-methyltransferase [Paraburkholderia xenovorans]AIP30967.1 macrocin-O-methyltransferase family protein [Paraburkholderia xenovorans LB400]
MSQVTLPDDFNADDYLSLNPDVRSAGVDPIEHYLKYGYAEKRAYRKISSILRPKIDESYEFDGLVSTHNHDFMGDARFKSAYARGMQAAGADYQWYWRIHIGLWAARSASRVRGDFVECGVNRGFLSSAIMKDLNWDANGRTFYLLDTFQGLDERYVSEREKEGGVLEKNRNELNTGFYTDVLSIVEGNFSEWSNKRIIVGSIPETLAEIRSTEIAFLHLDLNCSPPEVAAIECMWERISVGGIVLLDDYAYYGYQPQKEGMDDWSARNNVPVASLPTGQGLIIKA